MLAPECPLQSLGGHVKAHSAADKATIQTFSTRGKGRASGLQPPPADAI